MNICLVTLTFPPDREDGEAKFFRGIFDYLKKRHNVKLLTGKWDIEIKESGIKQFKLIRKQFLWIPQFSINVIKFIKSHQFDIIHGNGSKGSLPLVLSNQKRFISTIHDLGPLETNFTKLAIEKFLLKIVAQKATYITTCSNIIRKELHYFIPKVNLNNTFNLYSAVEDKYKPYPNEAKILKKKLEIEGPIILYVGRIASFKGVEDIINAYKIAKKDINDLNLVIGGRPDFFMEKIYQEWQHKYKDIKFVGFIPDDEIPIYYSMGDIFITYSYASEGFGLTPIESIACGTPVIASSMPAYKEVLKDNAILVPPKNPKKLAEQIVLLIKDEEKRRFIVEKAQKFIKRYSWDAVGRKLEEIYEKFLLS
ncbi:MAG: glycosyltransferase family 4 protein [Candidatus Thorarchaeota archaeon]